MTTALVTLAVATARAIHNAPVLEDEPSQLDLWDRAATDRKEPDTP